MLNLSLLMRKQIAVMLVSAWWFWYIYIYKTGCLQRGVWEHDVIKGTAELHVIRFLRCKGLGTDNALSPGSTGGYSIFKIPIGLSTQTALCICMSNFLGDNLYHPHPSSPAISFIITTTTIMPCTVIGSLFSHSAISKYRVITLCSKQCTSTKCIHGKREILVFEVVLLAT